MSKKLNGVWLSRYVYESSDREGEFEAAHSVIFQQQGKQLIGHSVADTDGSQLTVELFLEDSIATGTWQEVTSPTGHYQGATYYGAIQLALDPSHTKLTGKWLGFGRNLVINSGFWEFTRTSVK